MEINTILCGDALEILKTLPDGCVHMCVTSPPYYGLRDYGVDGQIGLEQSPEEYIFRLVEVFRELRRVLWGNGTLWLNLGDSYAGSGKDADDSGVKPKDMLGIPWALAFALRSDGWYLRSDIIWHKPNAMPHSVTDRPVNCYEHVFLLSKSRRYYFNYEALMEPITNSSKARMTRAFGSEKYADGAPGQHPQTINRKKTPSGDPEMRRGRDLWTIGGNHYRGAHFATYPEALVRPCIEAGCPEGGIVLDPFLGSGTTGVAAKKLGRNFLGIELNPEFIQLAQERIDKTAVA